MKWIKVSFGLPAIAEDIIGLNEDTGKMEFGFLSQVDIYNGKPYDGLWVDFSYPVTHWKYDKPPTEGE